MLCQRATGLGQAWHTVDTIGDTHLNTVTAVHMGKRFSFDFAILPSSLKGRLTVAVVVLVALSSTLVAAVALEIAYRDAIDTTGRQQYGLLKSAASHLEAELVNKQVVLRIIAEEIQAPARNRKESLQALLERHPNLRSSFSNVAILDSHGWVKADLITPVNVGRGPYDNREYLIDTLRTKRGVISQPFVSRLSERPVVLITEPLLGSQGEVEQVLAGSIDLSDPVFFGKIKGLGAGSTGYLFAISRKGMILHHPDRSRLTHNVNKEAGKVVDATKSAMDGWEGWTLAESKTGVPGILAYKQMQHPQWVLGSVYPAAEAFAGIARARRFAWIATIAIGFIAGTVGWATIERLIRPLKALHQHVCAVEHEKASIDVLDLDRQDEVGALGRAFHSLSVKREAAEQRLRALSQTDSLTGLGNRRQFEQEIEVAAEQANITNHLLAIGFLDIDHFKAINDTHGHAAGDAVLQEFARRLKESLRSTDQAFRLAGDEFVVLIGRVESAESIASVAENILRAIRFPFDYNGLQLAVTTSIGFVVTQPPSPQLGVLLQHADAALYSTKRSGRNGYTVKQLGRSAGFPDPAGPSMP